MKNKILTAVCVLLVVVPWTILPLRSFAWALEFASRRDHDCQLCCIDDFQRSLYSFFLCSSKSPEQSDEDLSYHKQLLCCCRRRVPGDDVRIEKHRGMNVNIHLQHKNVDRSRDPCHTVYMSYL